MVRGPVRLPKITRPRVGYAHARERLFHRLHDRPRPIVWISAPAGAGKTTLAASYTAAFDLRTLWYEIDNGDAEPASFFHHLGLAVKAGVPRARVRLPHLTPEYVLGLPAFSRRFFEELFTRMRAPSVIVFDRYEELSLDAPVHRWLADALAAAPDGIRVIVASRDEPPAEFARLRAAARMDCLRWDDLRLTEDEALGIARSLSARPDDAAAQDSVREVLRKADGWAAGLVLLLEAERTRVDGQPGIDPSRELLFDYFANEIFDRAEPEVQELLLSSALLPTMSARALAALTGDRRAERSLARLFRCNYFVTRLATEPPEYEYHGLFRQFLLRRGEETWTPEQRANLRRRAAQALLRTGASAAAVELLLQSEAWTEAAGEILRLAPELVSQGRVQVLDAWLSALPAPVTSSMPWLEYWHGVSAIGPDPARARARFESAHHAFRRRADPAGLYLTFADGIQLAWVAGFDFAAMDVWLDRFEQISADHPDVPSLDVEARVLTSLLMGAYFRKLGHKRIPDWLSRGRALLDTEGRPLAPLLRAALLSSLGWHYYGRGDFRSWLQRLNGFAAAYEADAPPLYHLHLLVSIGYGRLYGGECAAALAGADEGLRLAEESGVHVLDLMLIGVRIHAALVLQDRATADAGFRQMEAILASRPNTFYRSFECYLRCWRALLDDDLAAAIDFGEEAVSLAEAGGAPYPVAACRHALAHALLQSGQTARGWEALQRSRLRWDGEEHQHQAYQCELAEAWLRAQQGDRKSASALLEQALARGRAMGFGAPIMARPAFLYPLLQLALEQDIEADFAKTIIRQTRLAPPDPAEVPPEWPIPVRVHTMGTFGIRIDGRPLAAGALRRNRPLELLKALVALGGREVAQEHLAAALWPDAAGDQEIATLHTTLHRLRRLLERDDAVVLKDGHVSLDDRVVWVDVQAAWAVLDRLEAALVQTPRDGPRLETWQRRLESLCRGRFLELEPPRDWMLRTAEGLRERVVRAYLELGNHWQDAGAPELAIEARQGALRFDPLCEKAYGELMRLHADRADFAEALRVYERCRKALALHLNASPGPATRALYHSIRERLAGGEAAD